MLEGLVTALPLAAESGSGNFLVTPSVGLMIWTLIAFGASVAILKRLAYPKIQENLDKRRKAIEESIDASVRTKRRPTSCWRSTAPG